MKSAGHNSVYSAGPPRCRRLTGVLCMTTPSDLGDRRLFMPAFQVGRLRCSRSRGLLDAKSHFTLALMSAGEWRGVRTGRWCLQMRTPQTASHPDTRCWFDYGVACKRVYECMEQVRWYVQSRLSETEMSVTYIYLYFVRLEVSSLRLTRFFTTWECFQGEVRCVFSLRRWDHVCFWFLPGHIPPREVALFCVLGAIAHLQC